MVIQIIKLMTKARKLWLLAAAAIIVTVTGWSTTAFCGGVYVCKGSDGGSHFTNTPTSSDCKVFRKKWSSPFSGGRDGTGLSKGRGSPTRLGVPPTFL